MRKIEKPMRLFQETPFVFESKEAKEIIKNFNKIAKALIAYEAIWYEAWCKAVKSAKAGLNATIIVRHPETKALFVNFDPLLPKLMREVKCMRSLGQKVPKDALSVLIREEKLKGDRDKIQFLVRELVRVVSLSDKSYSGLAQGLIKNLEDSLTPGLTSISWMSLGIDDFIHDAHANIQKHEEMLNAANDILMIRINSNLRFIESCSFFDPNSAAMDISEFVKAQETFSQAAAQVRDFS